VGRGEIKPNEKICGNRWGRQTPQQSIGLGKATQSKKERKMITKIVSTLPRRVQGHGGCRCDCQIKKLLRRYGRMSGRKGKRTWGG